jgi:hypothetical protein
MGMNLRQGRKRKTGLVEEPPVISWRKGHNQSGIGKYKIVTRLKYAGALYPAAAHAHNWWDKILLCYM